jgi:hypothetical protein
MFDNEIDWVTRLERWRVRREACEPQVILRTRLIQGRAHAIPLKRDQASVQVRRVSLGVRLGSA